MTTNGTTNRIFDDAVDVNLSDVTFDVSIQPRAETIQEAVNRYADRIEEGDLFPPVDIFRITDNPDNPLVVADGVHRAKAHILLKKKTIRAIIHEGTYRDALQFALKANINNPLPLTSHDRQRSVDRILMDNEWCYETDTKIADMCGVSRNFVASRRAYSPNPEAHSQIRITTGLDGEKRTIKVRGQSKPKPDQPRRITPEKPLPTFGYSVEERTRNGVDLIGVAKSPPELRTRVRKDLTRRGERFREHVRCKLGSAHIVTDDAVYHIVSLVTIGAFHPAFTQVLGFRDAIAEEEGIPRKKRRAVIVGETPDSVGLWVEFGKGYGVEVVSEV